MPEVIDLSTLGKDAQEAVAAMAEKHDVPVEEAAPPLPKVRTAFLVIVQEDGDVFATSDLSTEFQREYSPKADDIYGACAVVQRDVQIQMSVQHTVIGMQQLAQQAQQQMQAAQIRSQLNLG